MNKPREHACRHTLASTARRIEHLLQQRLEPTHLEVRDESAAHVGHANAGKGHFRVKVVSTCFAGLKPLQRHRLVNEALSALLAMMCTPWPWKR